MTDNNMPELTLAPDTAAAAEIPTLTLTPEALLPLPPLRRRRK